MRTLLLGLAVALALTAPCADAHRPPHRRAAGSVLSVLRSVGQVPPSPRSEALERVYMRSDRLGGCRAHTVADHFRSGRFSVHGFAVQLRPESPIHVELRKKGGRWAPELVVLDAAGRPLFVRGRVRRQREIRLERLGGAAGTLEFTVTRPLDVRMFVTDAGVLASGLASKVPRRASYELSVVQDCPPPLRMGGWRGAYQGLTLDGASIPHAGMMNPSIPPEFKVEREPLGDSALYEGKSFVAGRVSWFGGKSDRGVRADETGAITGELLRRLGSTPPPRDAGPERRPENYYYAAMRFAYHPQPREWWKDVRLLVMNPANGRAVVVRPVDWGPAPATGRILDLSPTALQALGLRTDGTAIVAFAVRGFPLGPVSKAPWRAVAATPPTARPPQP